MHTFYKAECIFENWTEKQKHFIFLWQGWERDTLELHSRYNGMVRLSLILSYHKDSFGKEPEHI